MLLEGSLHGSRIVAVRIYLCEEASWWLDLSMGGATGESLGGSLHVTRRVVRRISLSEEESNWEDCSM